MVRAVIPDKSKQPPQGLSEGKPVNQFAADIGADTDAGQYYPDDACPCIDRDAHKGRQYTARNHFNDEGAETCNKRNDISFHQTHRLNTSKVKYAVSAQLLA